MVKSIAMKEGRLLCCDWGTSTFRLRLVDSNSLHTIAEVVTGDGNTRLFNQWSSDRSTERVAFYMRYLQRSIDAIAATTGLQLDGLPLVVSGMASSSVGMKELPYAALPFAIDGSNAKTKWLHDPAVLHHPLLLVSGVRHSGDVVRGEETELVGVIQLLGEPGHGGVYIFPGTHSKHLVVNGEQLVDSKTFMTGEVFELLLQHSILQHSVAIPQQISFDKKNLVAFNTGVFRGIHSPLLSSLFTVRVHTIDNHFSKEENYYYLSGLLIGNELSHLEKDEDKRVTLCCSGKLKPFYEAALQQVLTPGRYSIVPASSMDKAANAGQLKIGRNHFVEMS